jgi:hypothetical protein
LPAVEEVPPGEANGEEAPEDNEADAAGVAPDPALEPTPAITLPEEFDGQTELPEVK